jgi:hypothetical protein
MKIAKLILEAGDWKYSNHSANNIKADLVISFGARHLVEDIKVLNYLQSEFPEANVVMCSTAGEIIGDTVTDNTVVATALEFDYSSVEITKTRIKDHENSSRAGTWLAKNMNKHDLSFVLIISDGNVVNGSNLTEAFQKELEIPVPISGGLAGDGADFKKTVVGVNQKPEEGLIVVIGFYGKNLRIRSGSDGGWDPFGPEHVVTESNDNILVDLDGRNALRMYKDALGKYSDRLPASALLFPLSVKQIGSEKALTRTILSINEMDNTMIFAGNIPKGSKVRFMRANTDRLLQASENAAQQAIIRDEFEGDALALLISCVGRKLVLGSRTDEEVDVAKQVLGPKTFVIGFYSYGEISTDGKSHTCELHNQTMTITTIFEKKY